MKTGNDVLQLLNRRNREVFTRLVERYLANGNPVGSRSISREFSSPVSAATIRNVMYDLERYGLLESPHVSAGRLPTELGLRMFVDELLEIENISPEIRKEFEGLYHDVDDPKVIFDNIGTLLSRITSGASLVMVPKLQSPISHVEFVSLAPDRALVVLVTSDGNVENRVFTPPMGQTPASMQEAANYLNSVSKGLTVAEMQRLVDNEISDRKTRLDALATDLVKQGVAVCQVDEGDSERLIVRGRARLLPDDDSETDLDKVRELLDDLERKRDLARFLELVEQGEGVKVFIGSENKLFSLTGSTLVTAPYKDREGQLVGAVGVIGPTRLNYARIVPIVDYTAQLISSYLTADKK